MLTGEPVSVARKRWRSRPFSIRMQPWLTDLPTDEGSFVP
jgi:hypothetical protein